MFRKVFFVLFLLSTPTVASHIVGGEFELLHIADDRYRLNMILYFDVINGNPGARDTDVTVRIFRKYDNVPMMDVLLPFIQVLRVEYFQPECSNGEIITDKLIYSRQIILPAEVFDHQEGYYIAWERCCRNYTITNIFSENPNLSPNFAGQTFYLEFPPVVKNGQPFINSSPQLFPPLNDYACPNRPYWVDFAGIDVDGDSIAYTLVTPKNTKTPAAIPTGGPNSGPFPDVQWRPEFGIDNIMGGVPGLKISNKGFLTVQPTKAGLFVFAVKAEEYRNGEKIGEVIRDFQMLVLDQCPVAQAPVIKAKTLDGAIYNDVGDMTVVFSHTTSDADRCINIEISDPDASSPDDSFSETINLQVIALDILGDVDVNLILPQVSGAMLENGATATFDICFPQCPFVDRPYQLGIIAFDDACALPLSDTLRITVDIEPPPNTSAYFVTGNASVSIKEGDDYQLFIEGIDDQNDSLSFQVFTNGFELEDFGMSLDNFELKNGHVATTFNWATGCDIFDFTSRTYFLINLVVNDLDLCDFGKPDTLKLALQVILPPNTDPVISTDLTNLSIIDRINDPISFNVFGLDTDNDELELNIAGDGFELEDFGISFQNVTGFSSVSSLFSWDPSCQTINIEDKKDFRFFFILNDLDKCKFSNFDTLTVDVAFLPPNNNTPVISFNNLNQEVELVNQQASLIIGDYLSIDVIVNDVDNDNISLKLLSTDSLPGDFTFAPVDGKGSVHSILEWRTECSNLAEKFTQKSYAFTFVSTDNVCFNTKADTVTMEVDVKDIEALIKEFIPPNVFTPNKDGVNETFSIPNLPFDNCAGQFLSFRVFNRWGTEVYVTTDRNFTWDGKGLVSGVYFYDIKFTNSEFNGPLTVLY